MNARRHLPRIVVALAAVTATCVAPAVAVAAPSSAAPCGVLDIDTRVTKLVMSVGQERSLRVAFNAERACTFAVSLRTLDPDSGIGISPAQPVFLSTPASFTWRISGSKPAKDVLVGTLSGRDTTPFLMGVRLPEVVVHQATSGR